MIARQHTARTQNDRQVSTQPIQLSEGKTLRPVTNSNTIRVRRDDPVESGKNVRHDAFLV